MTLIMQITRRHILLLEVLIAFAIIVLCIFPLIYPHAAMAKSQREFIRKIELDHVVTLLFGQVYEDLQTNKIPWSAIEAKQEFEIPSLELQKLNHGRPLPFKGSYFFELEKHKPKGQTPQEIYAYIYNLHFKFQPTNGSFKMEELAEKTIHYNYQVFILRDLKSPEAKQKTHTPPQEEK